MSPQPREGLRRLLFSIRSMLRLAVFQRISRGYIVCWLFRAVLRPSRFHLFDELSPFFFQILAHFFCAFFAFLQNQTPFVFMRFRTLWQKHGGWVIRTRSSNASTLLRPNWSFRIPPSVYPLEGAPHLMLAPHRLQPPRAIGHAGASPVLLHRDGAMKRKHCPPAAQAPLTLSTACRAVSIPPFRYLVYVTGSRNAAEDFFSGNLDPRLERGHSVRRQV